MGAREIDRTACILDVRYGSKADIRTAQRHVRFTPESDICSALAHVCFGPKADIVRSLFHHLDEITICFAHNGCDSDETPRLVGDRNECDVKSHARAILS